MDASELRREYTSSSFSEADAHRDPIEQFRRWFEEALSAHLYEPNAMTLATATPDGGPSARIVLLKGYDERGFVFHTNYTGRKGQELECNPRAALVFYWDRLERQVRVEGRVSRISDEESDTYFESRPRGGRIGAWVSEQSRPVESRAVLEERLRELEEQYEGREEIPRPPHWGGCRVFPETVEFWQGRPNRLHDRLLYVREADGWTITRLQP